MVAGLTRKTHEFISKTIKVYPQINFIPDTKGHVVYKLWYNKKYIVVAGKTMYRSIQNINTGLSYFFKDTVQGRNPNDVFYNFYCHVDDNPFEEFKIEVVLDVVRTHEAEFADHFCVVSPGRVRIRTK